MGARSLAYEQELLKNRKPFFPPEVAILTSDKQTLKQRLTTTFVNIYALKTELII